MSTFMQLMEGKSGADVVESVRVSKTGTMFFKMNGKEVTAAPFVLLAPSIHTNSCCLACSCWTLPYLDEECMLKGRERDG